MGWLEELGKRLGRDANVAATVNVAKGEGAHTSVRRHQRVVQRNGETTVITETHVDEEHADDREG